MIGVFLGQAGKKIVLAFLVIFAWSSTGWAVKEYKPSPQEIKQLPQFCAWKFSGDPGLKRRGLKVLGEQFKNVHHLCTGLNFLNRYYRNMSAPDAKSNLARALLDFNYMVDHMFPNSRLAGHIHLYRGITHDLMKHDLAAVEDYRKAIAYKPNLSKAYARLADYYKKHGQKAVALKVVTEGLRHVPNSNALKRRYLALGGKRPFPRPVKRTKKKERSTKPASKSSPALS